MDYTSTVDSTIISLLNNLGLSNQATTSVSYDEANNVYNVTLKSEDPAVLIGYHGENLSSMQLILGQHLHASLGEWLNVSLNINDYKQRRESALHALADSAVSRVVATNQAHSLPPMPANERRIIHLYLAEHPQVSTSSDGVGKSRSIIISPRSS